MDGDEAQITRLLSEAQQGDSQAASELFPLVYSALRELARRQLNGERRGHTLQPTALVHEVYLKLLGGQHVSYNGREHFFRVAAEAMRRILIDHAKAKKRVKRGGGQKVVSLEDCQLAVETHHEDLLNIEEAICRLESMDANAAAVIRMRFYIGMSVEDVAAARGASVSTIRRECAYARAFLVRDLRNDDP
jgi:RNA polymerase sigma factor (TIGR02999 family)